MYSLRDSKQRTMEAYQIAGTDFIALQDSAPPTVIGKMTTEKIVGLTEEDIQYCMDQGWKVDAWSWNY